VAEGWLPSLLGYIGASQKETARVLLKSDEDDPILTVWQYGLGKTVAWNSDISGKWSSNYISWDKNLKLWQNIINFTVENYEDQNVSMAISQQGDKATVKLTDAKNEEELDTNIVVVSPSGESKEEKLYPTAPGEYTSTIDIKESGVYMINGKQLKNGETVNAVNAGYAVQYSPEYRLTDNSSNIDKLVASMGGKLITSPKEVFLNDALSRKGQKDLTPFLLALALLLFMFDVAIRRININTAKLKALLKKLRRRTSTVSVPKVKRTSGGPSASQALAYDILPDVAVEAKGKVEEKPAVNKEVKEETAPADTPRNQNSLDTSQLLKNRRFKK
jgi:hypothetical protein